MADKPIQNKANTTRTQVEINRNEKTKQDKESMSARTHVVTGSVDIPTSGDAVVHVNFPVRFFNKPNSTFGGSMAPNSEVIPGVFPSLQAVVLRYDVEELPPNNEVDEHALYVGADVAVSARGAVSNGFILDFRFEGVAMVNPTSGIQDDELTDEI